MYEYKYILMNKIHLHVIYYIYIYMHGCKKLQLDCTIGLHKADLMQQNSSHQYAIKQNH